MKTVAIVLSGCGFLDGSEIYEAVLTFLALDRRNLKYHCFAPTMAQTHVINFKTGEPMAETRNTLVESARLARGDIDDLANADANAFDALIFPGGFGAINNLCDFASQGAHYTIHPAVQQFAQQFIVRDKPIGFICIAPALIPALYGTDVTLTIGHDPSIAATLEIMGVQHFTCDASHIVLDAKHKVVTTPAFMVTNRISEVAEGIDKLVDQVIAFTDP